MIAPPNVDDRKPRQFAAQVRELLDRDLPERWRREGVRGESGEALISIFGHLCGTVTERLNRAPYKNLLAFLELQGVSLRPSQVARVPLTFQLTEQHHGHVRLPAHTQVAAAPEPEEHDPVLFETEGELMVTSAKLSYVGTKDGPQDRYSDYSFLSKETASPAVPVLRGTTAIEHLLHIALGLPLPLAVLKELRLKLQLSNPGETPANPWFEWGVRREHDVLPLTPVEDGTNGLTRSGDVVFHGLSELPVTDLTGVNGQWLVCRLTAGFGTGSGAISPASVPSLGGVQIGAVFARDGMVPDAAFANQVALDLTKEFFPFGERPKFGDTFYLGGGEAFRCAGSNVTLHLVVANPDQKMAAVSVAPVRATAVKLLWEIGDGKSWIELGIGESGRELHDEATGFSDTTRAFTSSGTVAFRVPKDMSMSALNRTNSVWVRVRIVGGDYGLEAHYEKVPAGGVTVTPATFAPPSLGRLLVDYRLETTWTAPAVIGYNDFTYSRIDLKTGPVPVFQRSADPYTCAYLGFVDKSGFSERFMSMYVAVSNPEGSSTPFEISAASPMLIWEYWNGKAWTKTTVLDETDGLTRSGIVRFLAPNDFRARPQFGESVYWLRFRLADNTQYEPWVSRIALNTAMAAQAVSFPAEILGSSNGSAGQKFVTTRSPLLEGQHVSIREPMNPPPEEVAAIEAEEGPGAIQAAARSHERPGEVWVRWHEVPNFEASIGRERHYIIDRTTGEILFGDGVNGHIPPIGSRNVRIGQYRTGGGAIGNRKANTITHLKTAVPYIQKVTNLEPACGGADGETYEAMLRRAPRQIRHRSRAVAAQDFEDLALMASPEVAHARCVPMRDLSPGSDAQLRRPGVVSLIIAPIAGHSGRPVAALQGPQPSRELLDRVRIYLNARRASEADLVITGPEYLAIEVEIEVTVKNGATPSDIEGDLSRAILRFLDPVKGNRDGSGWQFGLEPVRADLFALAEEVPGVDHVRELRITRIESRPGLHASGHFLICGAEPRVTATLET